MYTFKNGSTFSVAKAFEANLVLRQLRRFLDENEPALVYWLKNTWRSQGQAITYKELRESIIRGDVSWDILEEWQKDYAVFVTNHLQPAWVKAMKAAAKNIARRYPGWYFSPFTDGVKEWTERRSAQFVTEVSSTQIDGLRALVRRAAVLEDMSVDQLSKAIRPMVGLTKPQALANMRYYEMLINGGMAEERALDLAMKYAERQHRYRGYNIARTELAYSYNQGTYEGTKQAQEKGYMGDVVKIWCTADDERVCKICGALEGETIGMDEPFNINQKLPGSTIQMVPPAHPSCRCSVMYKEITPPIIKT